MTLHRVVAHLQFLTTLDYGTLFFLEAKGSAGEQNAAGVDLSLPYDTSAFSKREVQLAESKRL